MLVALEPKVLTDIYNSECLNMSNAVVLNFISNSAQTKLEPIVLFPLVVYGHLFKLPEYEFDKEFVNLTLSMDSSFHEFFKIVRYLNGGKDVFILIWDCDIMNPITESLLKLIQQRYGYNYQWIKSVDDFNPNDQQGFTAEGILTFEQDLDRDLAFLMKQYPELFMNEKPIEDHI